MVWNDTASALVRDLTENDFRLSILVDYFKVQPTIKPKSARLYEACLKMIENGYWTPGDRVPSEKDLSQLLPVGLSTVQTALRRLAETGLIQRKRKAGSFVCEPAAIGRELAYFLFLDDDGKNYLPTIDVEIEVYETSEQGDWSDFLGEAMRYICIERILGIGSEFRIHNKIYLGHAKFRPLLHFATSELRDLSLRILFQDKFGMPPLGTDRCIRFSHLSEKLAAQLNEETGKPSLLYEIRQYTVRNDPLFFMQTVVPQNNRKLRVCTSTR